MNKKRSQRIHAKRRAGQRYGINLGRGKHDAIVNLIRSDKAHLKGGKVVHIRKITNRLTQFFVWCDREKEWLNVVYDKTTKQLATVIPSTNNARKRPDYVPQ